MPADSDDLLAQQLRQLRREYLRDSSHRVDELRQMKARLAADPGAVIAELRQAFHRLAGSGGSYGFPDVSARSREGERLTMQIEPLGTATPADVDAIDRCIRAVADAFAAARESLGPDATRGS